MTALLARYGRAMQAAPLRTNLATAVPLMVLDNLCAQQLEHRQRGGRSGPVDAQRTVVMSSYSGFIFTPVFFYLYKVMDRFLVGPPVALALQKAVGSVVVGGIPANTAFLALATAVEMKIFGKQPASGASLTEVVSEKWQHDLPRVGEQMSYSCPIAFSRCCRLADLAAAVTCLPPPSARLKPTVRCARVRLAWTVAG